MTDVPLAKQAYKRDFAGNAEIRLENRFAESNPLNTREGVGLLARPGTNSIEDLAGGANRGNYSKLGMFNTDLFVVNGQNLWRVSKVDGSATQITGTVANFGNPYVTWMKGIGYEYMFISDGSTIQYFSEHAAGILTLTGNITAAMIIKIGATYFGWNANVDANAPAGTLANPYLAKLASGGLDTAANNSQSLANMVLLLNGAGVPGGDYSSAVTAPNADVSATSTDTTLVVTAVDNTSAGNAIATTAPVDGGGSIAWGATTLSGGGGTQLRAVTGMAATESARACANVSGYVLVSVGNSEKFYWINPGEVTIDPLNFASKESNPDNILDMLTVGDQVLICGDGSAENWYASGDFTAPLVPQEGRVYRRGVIEGTPVVVNDSVILVGNNNRVYSVGYSSGADGQWGVKRISTHAIEERIRKRLRYEQGLPL